MGFRISGLLRASGFEAIGFWDQGLESRTVVGLQWRERIIFSQNSDYKAEKDFHCSKAWSKQLVCIRRKLAACRNKLLKLSNFLTAFLTVDFLHCFLSRLHDQTRYRRASSQAAAFRCVPPMVVHTSPASLH